MKNILKMALTMPVIKNIKKYKKILLGLLIFFVAVFVFETFIPNSLFAKEAITYDVKKGVGGEDVAKDLYEIGIVKSPFFFKLYAVLTGNHGKIQAGKYEISPSMSTAEIIKKMALGQTIKERITILEGWDLEDIAKHLESRNLYSKEDFFSITNQDFSNEFAVLSDKPNAVSIEGYIFPDTYYVSYEEGIDDLIKTALANFNSKLDEQMRSDIILQKKSVFKIITMASILEKEANNYKDKKIIAGILWKRIEEGVPLQVDATVNYVTGRSDPKVAIKDTKIDSPYNTYKYYGLPKGPISNPGLESILAAIYSEDSPYWYYLSADGTGETIYSKTFDEHLDAQRKYFR
ncbi:MAG: endolytic transglycosylase MltG [Candidatus Staskawiczbacteria bacterium]|nr:endolytic transglycosylase MltG [Candidatus Staskawiczbacteria bacterium]